MPHKYRSLSEVACLIGVSKRFLQFFVRGKGSRGVSLEVLPHQKRGRRIVLKAGETYDHIKKYSRRTPKNLQVPMGYVSAPSEVPDVDISPGVVGDDVHLALRNLMNDPVQMAKFSSDQLRAYVAIASELRRKSESDLKREALVKPDQVVRMLRSMLDLMVHLQGEVRPARLADTLIQKISQLIGINLRAKYPGVDSIFHNAIATDANTSLDELREQVVEQVNGVRALEGTV